jgi:hypothetical protein
MSMRRFKKYLKNRSLSGFYSDDYMEVLRDEFGGSMGLISGNDGHLAIRVTHNDGKKYRLFYMIEDDESLKGFKHLTLLKVYNDEEIVPKKNNPMTRPVEIINDILEDSEIGKSLLCYLLTKYVHSSHRICNSDGSIYQPSFPNRKVVDYRCYADKELFGYAHKTNRLLLIFDDNTEYEISLYKFKRFVKDVSYLLDLYYEEI